MKPVAETPEAAIRAASEYAPYLARLLRRRPDTVDRLSREAPDVILRDVLSTIRAAQGETLGETLRQAKMDTHLICAAADLSRVWDWNRVTAALSDVADASLEAALATACQAETVAMDGIFVIALGKLGAGELNYSSDIDVSVFYEPDRFSPGTRAPGEVAVRVARRLVALLEEMTEFGYAFRTDLRLRPDPRSTPLAVSTVMAENYYETVGQNWERMVYIKARPAAGDRNAAARFLGALEPYVWRRNMDYWAIGDIHAIKRQINRVGKHAELDRADADLKLGPGGIREIEFFAQTQQLILGGRFETLRGRRTVDMLEALAALGVTGPETVSELSVDYAILRDAEHRVQMLNDEQSHTLPADPDRRRAVARLSGHDDLATFDSMIHELRTRVNRHYAELFEDEDRRFSAARSGNLVFTGVDADPGTLSTLTEMGFKTPDRVFDTISEWHRGKVPATRTVRGREILTALVPELLVAMAETGEPDTAFGQFSTFLSGLSSGVQTLSMLLAEPALLRDLVETLALAPKLSKALARRPALLESLLYAQGGLDVDLSSLPGLPFDRALDEARRRHRETAFRIAFGILHRGLSAQEAGEAFTSLADRTIAAMADVSRIETERRFGPMPGRYVVCGMGKLGGRELSSGSDLDIVVIYELDSDGGGATWFTRFTQTLITALSAPTAEGLLYDVDMQLRPSGNAGPVAIKVSAFEQYQHSEAWTWEHMALTRLRVVCGDVALGRSVERIALDVLRRERDQVALRADVCDMRQRLARERPGKGLWDLKLDPGGFVDLEFTVQYLVLANGASLPGSLVPGSAEAIATLRAASVLSDLEAETLSDGLKLLHALQQVLRIAVDGAFDPADAPEGLKDILAEVGGANNFAGLEDRLKQSKSKTAALRLKKVGPLATET